MKVLGKGSISSAIESVLIVVFVALVIALIVGGVIIVNQIETIMMNPVIAAVLIIILISVCPGLMIIQTFIKIFSSLKNEEIFSMENAKRLKTAYITSLVLGVMYVINAILIVVDAKMAIEMSWSNFINGIYALLVATLFIVFGIGLIVLNKIYIKAIEYKNENELTI